jgi:hypothetical protein
LNTTEVDAGKREIEKPQKENFYGNHTGHT